MENNETAIGRTFTWKEVSGLSDGTRIWIESDIPVRNVFLGVKQGCIITNLAGDRRYTVGDVGSICTAKEWLYKANN